MSTNDALIFDNDGVLTTPTGSDVWLDGTAATSRELGVDPVPDGVEARSRSIGRTDEAIAGIERICRPYGLDPAAFWRTREGVVADAQRESLVAGEKRPYDDVDAVFDLDAEFAIVSDNQHRTLEHIADHISLSDEFSTYHGREPTFDGLRMQKPDPHYVERAMDEPGSVTVLFVGDSSNDVDAARAAGIDSAFVRRPRKADLELEREPTYEIEALANSARSSDGTLSRPPPPRPAR